MRINATIGLLVACLATASLLNCPANAGMLSALVAQTPPKTDLTTEGTLDWAHWGGGNAIPDDPAAYNHKDGVTPLLSTYTLVGPDAATSANQWNDAGSPLFTWSDGTPTLSGAGIGYGGSYFPNTGTSFAGLGDGYQITVPASTRPQVLKVYSGCYSALANFHAALSDNSAPAYNDQTMDDQTGNNYNGVYTILYAAGSASQTLTVTITMTNVNEFDTNYANVTLAAATLAGPEPTIVTAPASTTNWIGMNQRFTVTPGGAPPFSYQWWGQSRGVYVPLADGGQISGARSNALTINNLVFANATNYYVVVSNVYGAITSSVASLAVLPITGALTGVSAAAPPTVDLTAVGALDWAAWGLNLVTDFDQKADGSNQISNFTVIGPNPGGPYRYDNALAAFSWSDGTPDATAFATTTGIYVNGVNNGYQLRIPADQTKRIVTVFAGGWNTTVHFEALLSDFSAPTYVDESLFTPPYSPGMAAYTVEYVANSPGQTLTINVFCATDGGNVTLMAATLQGPQPVILSQPGPSTNWVGQAQVFSVGALGWPSLGYQWWREANGLYAPLANGGQFSGATTPILTISNLTFANATNYHVVVTNAYGSVTSSPATLTILPPIGTLQGSVNTNIGALTVVDLTAEGTLDWADWGLVNLLDFNDKAVGGIAVGLISDWTLYGPGSASPTLDNYGDQPYGLSWTDGTPTPAAATAGSSTANYVYVGSLGSGFQFTVAADTTGKVLKLYYMGWGCRTRLMAALSDNSAPPFVNDSVDDPAGNIAYGVATIYFAAASSGQTLTVTDYDVLDYMGGNVGITAATLAKPSPVTLTYSRSGSSLQLTWPYGTLLQATNVAGPWSVNGNASPYAVSTTGQQMFYRVRE